jgi:putative Holliday junction resolvase
MRNGRRIAFDYGDVRIGVAVSDASGLLATPHGVIDSQGDFLAEIGQLITEFEPIYFAVGIPRHLSGSASSKMASVEGFISSLAKFNLPIIRIDERLTTVSASRSLRESGKNAKESKSFIDAAAAALILEMALNQEKVQSQVNGEIGPEQHE